MIASTSYDVEKSITPYLDAREADPDRLSVLYSSRNAHRVALLLRARAPRGSGDLDEVDLLRRPFGRLLEGQVHLGLLRSPEPESSEVLNMLAILLSLPISRLFVKTGE